MNEKRVLLLSADDETSHIVYHELKKSCDIVGVIIDVPVSKKKFLRKRIHRLGFMKVVDQVFYKMLIDPILKRISEKRVNGIIRENGLNIAPFNRRDILFTGSANSRQVVDLLREIKPGLVIVNGTRILREEVLGAVPAGFINIHTGITPLYRGVHGGYWALVNKDAGNAGVTVHFVDKGIDTGSIIAQQKIFPTPADNIRTYPYLQYAAAIPLLQKAIDLYFSGIRTIIPAPEGESHLYFHPTFTGYLYNLLINHVK